MGWGTAITTDCKVNMETKKVFDIKVSEDTADMVNSLDEEYVMIDGTRFDVFEKDEAGQNDFWYEGDE